MDRYFVDTNRGSLQEQPPKTSTVALNDFSCPRKSILNTLPARMTMQPKFKIFWAIVQAITIFMMYALLFFQRSSQYLLHYPSVFHYPFARGNSNQGVSMVIDVSFMKRFPGLRFSGRSASVSAQWISVTIESAVVSATVKSISARFVAPINGAWIIRCINSLYRSEQFPFSVPTIMSFAPSTCIDIGSTSFNRAEGALAWRVFIICCFISYGREQSCSHLLLVMAATVATAVNRGVAAFYGACTWYDVHTVRPQFLSSRPGSVSALAGAHIITLALYHTPACEANLFPFVFKEVHHEILVR